MIIRICISKIFKKFKGQNILFLFKSGAYLEKGIYAPPFFYKSSGVYACPYAGHAYDKWSILLYFVF